MENKKKLGLMCIFFGEFGVHNFMNNEKRNGILNILISLFYLLGALLLILLIALIICLFNIENNNYYNTTYISRHEAYLEPKLFEKGTGFWDGTKEYENIVLNPETNLPAEFYEKAVSNLEITGKKYVDVTNKYGKGGYVVVRNNTEDVTTFCSYSTTFTSNGNYTVKVIPYNLDGYKDAELASYAIYIKYNDSYKEEKRILLKDYSKDYFTYTLDISSALSMNDITEVKNASIEFLINPSTTSKASYVMFEQILFDANETVSNYEELTNEISIIDANKSLLLTLGVNGEKPLGYWSGTSEKAIHNVELTMCNFTFDTYEFPYGNKEVIFSFSQLESLRKKGYCDYDKSDIPGTFVNLNPDKCPVSEVTDITYNSITGKPLEVHCVVKGYLTYTHGSSEPVYTKAPKFILGTDERGFDVLGLLLPNLIATLIIMLIMFNFVYIVLVLVRKIIYITKGIRYLSLKK